MKSNSRILLGFAVAFAVIAILTFFTYHNFQIATTNSVGYNNTLNLLKTIDRLTDDILIMDSEGRGLISKYNAEQYKKYSTSVTLAKSETDSLKKYSSYDSKVSEYADSISNNLSENILFRNQIIKFIKTGKVDKAFSLVNTMKGKNYMDAIRNASTKIKSIGQSQLLPLDIMLTYRRTTLPLLHQGFQTFLWAM